MNKENSNWKSSVLNMLIVILFAYLPLRGYILVESAVKMVSPGEGMPYYEIVLFYTLWTWIIMAIMSMVSLSEGSHDNRTTAMLQSFAGKRPLVSMYYVAVVMALALLLLTCHHFTSMGFETERIIIIGLYCALFVNLLVAVLQKCFYLYYSAFCKPNEDGVIKFTAKSGFAFVIMFFIAAIPFIALWIHRAYEGQCIYYVYILLTGLALLSHRYLLKSK